MKMDNALQTARLSQFSNSGDYELVCAILREELERAHDELLKCDIANPTAVLAYHVRAKAFRELSERFIKRVESCRAVAPVEQLSESELANAIIRNPERYL